MSSHYFRVIDPFRVYILKGHSASNYYAGASRMYLPAYHALNVQAGDEIHILPGGVFLSHEDGPTHEIALKAPKPPFEKDYGPSFSAENFLRSKGCSEVPGPRAAADYRAAREAARAELPEHSHGVVELEPSPEMQDLLDATSRSATALFRMKQSSANLPGKPVLVRRDINAYSDKVSVLAYFGETDLDLMKRVIPKLELKFEWNPPTGKCRIIGADSTSFSEEVLKTFEGRFGVQDAKTLEFEELEEAAICFNDMVEAKAESLMSSVPQNGCLKP